MWKQRRLRKVQPVTSVHGWRWERNGRDLGQRSESLYHGGARVAMVAENPDGTWYWFVVGGNPDGIPPADSRLVFKPYAHREIAQHDALHHCRTALARGCRVEDIAVGRPPGA